MTRSTMPRNLVWALSTLSAVVLAFSFDAGLGHSGTDRAIPSANAGAQPASDAPTGGTGSGTGSSGAGGSSPASSASGTYTGTAVQTRYGPVQVKIVVADGKISSATAVQYPRSDPHDARINNRAVPLLQQQTIRAQSAQLDGVSGATFTSQGYISSLQSAIDQANL